jgi:hypothetical protein
MKKPTLVLGAILTLASTLVHAELVQQFKNPAFNGVGYSSHVLTVDSIEKSRRDAIESQRKADIAAQESALSNTPLARFMNLFQSQVYAQLATQLSNNLFQTKCSPDAVGCTNPTTGAFSLDGNTVTWNKTSTEVVLTVVDAKGTVTTVNVPIASFSF